VVDENQIHYLLMVLEDLAVRRVAAPNPEFRCPNCRQSIQHKPVPSIGLSNVCRTILGEAPVEEISEERWTAFFQSSPGIQLVIGAFVLEPHFTPM
jgi:hypothetical protein